LTLAASICDELRGALPAGAAQRFRGVCDASFFKLQGVSGANGGGGSGAAPALSWRFMPITVKSQVTRGGCFVGLPLGLQEEGFFLCQNAALHTLTTNTITYQPNEKRTTSPRSARSTRPRLRTSRPT
jgi:hypothetical protein